MSFDTLEAKKIINSLRAHTRQPGGELMDKAANSLDSALQDAMNATAQVRAAEGEAMKAKNAYDDTLLEIKRLREKMPLLESALGAIRTIATSKRGANKVATDWLQANNLAPTTTVTEEAKA